MDCRTGRRQGSSDLTGVSWLFLLPPPLYWCVMLIHSVTVGLPCCSAHCDSTDTCSTSLSEDCWPSLNIYLVSPAFYNFRWRIHLQWDFMGILCDPGGGCVPSKRFYICLYLLGIHFKLIFQLVGLWFLSFLLLETVLLPPKWVPAIAGHRGLQTSRKIPFKLRGDQEQCRTDPSLGSTESIWFL